MSATKPLILLDPYPRSEAMVYTEDTRDKMESMARVVSHFGSRAPDDMVEEALPELEVIVGQTHMSRQRIERATKLRAIMNVKCNWEDSLDYQAAAAAGIYVLSAAPAMAPAVAEFCLGQAIALGRGLPAANDLFRSGGESYGIKGNGSASSLRGAQVGMVGFGNVGRELAALLLPFTDKLQAHDPWLSAGHMRMSGVGKASLDEVLACSDYLFLLATPTADNEGFLGKAQLSRLRPGCCLVLASRAEIVDFDALLDCARQGKLRAAIDVFPEEPVPKGAAWRDTPNVLFTSHLAGGLESSYALIREMMIEDIGQVLAGLPPLRMQRAEPALAAISRSR